MSWFLFVLIGLLFNSIAAIERRKLMTGKNKLDYFTTSYLVSVTTALTLGVYSLTVDFEMPPISSFWLVFIINMAMGIGGWLSIQKALSLLGFGETTILLTTRQVITWIASVTILGISLSALQALGTLIIIAALFIVYFNGRSLKSSAATGVFFALLTAFIHGLAILTDQVIYRESMPTSYMLIGFSITAIVLGLIRPKVFKSTKQIITGKRRTRLLWTGALTGGSLALIFEGLKIADNAPLVSALIQFQIILSVLLGIILLGERENLRRKLLGTMVATVGTILLVI